jgi:hypothetical protein
MNNVKIKFSILFLTVVTSIFLISFTFPDNNPSKPVVTNSTGRLTTAPKLALDYGTLLYDSLDLKETGLSKEVFDYAYKGYEKLRSESAVGNDQYLTIVDFSQSSRKKRFYLVDVKNYKLVVNTFVAHGKNTGVDMATKFSNIPESNQSSLGFYVTKNTYIGKHGLSLRVAGMEAGFNDKAEARAIVVHGADYVNPGRVNSGYMGRSQGCPALPENVSAEVINRIKDGSTMFLYYPAQDYLRSSRIINS